MRVLPKTRSALGYRRYRAFLEPRPLSAGKVLLVCRMRGPLAWSAPAVAQEGCQRRLDREQRCLRCYVLIIAYTGFSASFARCVGLGSLWIPDACDWCQADKCSTWNRQNAV
jgi:hypothetical protein